MLFRSFIAAMLAIGGEIEQIRSGKIKVEDSALRNAPHTAEAITAENWAKPYSRHVGAFPGGIERGLMRAGKYWPTVGRIDGAYGDRNLVCACEPIEALAINS